jgi:hypothetical protein
MHSLLFAAAFALSVQDAKPAPPIEVETPAGQAEPAAQAEPEGDSVGGTELPEGSANLDFVMLNRTGQTIVELNISPAGEESWSDNLLHYPEVPDQERAAASYARDVELCRWDIRVRFPSGQRRSWPAMNLCDTVRVELR